MYSMWLRFFWRGVHVTAELFEVFQLQECREMPKQMEGTRREIREEQQK